ncbi:MAG: 2-oxoacid:acceptor oxidoreductase subunit alpha [Sedimentisphaerales bacterium]|nr:2-oxoacid:acceptor oxidoreductase subunit alpha [Sedimentisphaerales bacterium]
MCTATAKGVQPDGPSPHSVEELSDVAVRFAGDSGDGMQLVGTQFTNTTAVFGNDVATFPDYPSEIRAPAGTLAGVSGFQIRFGDHDVRTPGDRVDALIAMNPAALKVNIRDLRDGGLLLVDTDEFTEQNLKRAKFDTNPLEGEQLALFRVYRIPISSMTMDAVQEAGLAPKQAHRCKNFFTLGLVLWLYDRPLDTTLNWVNTKFGKIPSVAHANTLALKAGYNFAETAEMFPVRYRVREAKLEPGHYRNLTGNQATALGLITAARLAGKPLFYGSYPITPASDILHDLAAHKNYDVRTFQAEDEIAAMASVVGAAYGGAIAVTGSSGPGVALKTEALGLAVMTELPCVIVNVQRGGPSTGLPTKTEQADLFQAVYGRNGECPIPVLAAQSGPDCFWSAIEAVRVAIKYMTPVILLTDGYLANGSEPWRIPDVKDLPKIEVTHPTDPTGFAPYQRNEWGARPWAIPGTPGLEHRIGGLEKSDISGHVNQSPENHQHMVGQRARKVANIVNDIPDQKLHGEESGDLLVVSWGGTHGAVRSAVAMAQREGLSVTHMHMRWLFPMPRNIGDILKRFKRVLVCELNMGQLRQILRASYLVDAQGLNKVKGRPFMISEVYDEIVKVIGGK